MKEISYDKFSDDSIKDPQKTKVYDFCAYSGDEIYLGQSYLLTSKGDVLKDDLESVVGYYHLHRFWAGEEVI